MPKEIFRNKPTLVGHHVLLKAVLNQWSELDRSCNFHILLGPAGRNRGLGSETTRLMLDYAFGATGIDRIELDVYDFNPRAQHVYEAAGFIHEGRKREAFRFDNQPVDGVMMSILRSDWEAMSRP